MGSKYVVVPVLLAVALADVAVANPSVGSGSTQSVDGEESSSTTRDKKMSVDKSRAESNSQSNSAEHAREHAKERSTSHRAAQEKRQALGFSQEVNVNSMLLQAFMQHYENQDPADTQLPMAIRYFATCKPLTGAETQYPTLNSPNLLTSTYQLLQPNMVVDRQSADLNLSASLFRAMWKGPAAVPDAYPAFPSIPTVSRYAQCRITASYWLAEAGEHISQQAVQSSANLPDHIEQIFRGMDATQGEFDAIRQRARDDWGRAICTPWLRWYGDYKGPEIQCGVFQFQGDTMYVDRRQTLSDAAIGGVSYRVTLNRDDSKNVTTEVSDSSSDRTSSGSSNTSTSESTFETRRSTALEKSHSLSSSNKNSASSNVNNSLNATPGQ